MKYCRAACVFVLLLFGRSAPMTASPRVQKFDYCFTGGGTNCVVDGDTFWINGVKVRIADIDAPETHSPRCAREAALGNAATRRLYALLNAGPFRLQVADRDTDRYGRKLRIVVRNGSSIGEDLVAEGLARRWDGARHPWCPTARNRLAS
jgi:micrococcal nuclease